MYYITVGTFRENRCFAIDDKSLLKKHEVDRKSLLLYLVYLYYIYNSSWVERQ